MNDSDRNAVAGILARSRALDGPRAEPQSLGLVDLDIGYSMTATDGWYEVTLSPAFPLRCEACHAEGRPPLHGVMMLCVQGPQLGRILCDRHYGKQAPLNLCDMRDDPFAEAEGG